MRFQHTQEQDDNAIIDMTPLIDIVFILLIFFILTASFQQQNTINIDRPQSTTNDSSDVVKLMVTIDKEGQISLDQGPIKLTDLSAYVKAKVSLTGSSSAVIQVDKDVTSDRLITVIDKIRIAGVANVAVATDKI
ncbi:MAG: biopolymer transporter ExbD [Moritella sp.]|uniref:ExbD/TolR family protein n=1 Tax=Moritella sp. TaxID=78556 RepID=UPI001DD962A3|nr:biopolymer transporter ExbD [Moritella sp.]NQZ49232.1 biopolymer transporter ExbD [Moritella sp.]